MTKKFSIIANWKMSLNSAETEDLISRMRKNLKTFKGDAQIVVCPSYPFLERATILLSDSKIKLGAQDLFWEEEGAYTGEISGKMLKEIGVEFVIIGHSERRKYLSETDEMVNKKVKAALANDLTPIICIGETFEERQNGQTDMIIAKQVTKAVKDIEPKGSIVIAYEPVWVIGSGQAIKPAEADEAAIVIRQALIDSFGVDMIKKHFCIIYGGSVDAANVKYYVDGDTMCGVLVGGASLEANKFMAIIDKVVKN